MDFSLWVDAFTLNQHFIANYASTIDAAQGTRVDVPFSIWEMDHPRFSLNRFNSAVGRAVRADLVHFSNTDTSKQYEWQQYPTHVYLNDKPQNTDKRYKKTIFYIITLVLRGVKYYYRGHTILRKAEARLEEHLHLSRTHATDRFHKKLAQADHSLVTIETTHVKHFSSRAEAEYFEMKLLEKDSKTYPKLMLNTRHKRKDVKQIKEASVNTITESEYRELTEDKK